jgi:acetyl-CoA acyltransferase
VRDIFVRGSGMTRFGLQLDRSLKDLTAESIGLALEDARVDHGEIDGIFFGNCLAGLVTGQEATRAPITCMPAGFGEIPIHAIENACASGADALHMAYMAIASGMHRNVLVVGAEKANHVDRQRSFAAYRGGLDVEEDIEKTFEGGEGFGRNRTVAVDRHALIARRMMADHGMTIEDIAQLAAVGYRNAAANPNAHRGHGPSAQDVLDDRVTTPPITRLMMCPISDGAAAVVVSPDPGSSVGGCRVRIASSRVATRYRLDEVAGPSAIRTATTAAYSDAGIEVADVDFAELHDASVAYLLLALVESGLCPPGDEVSWIRAGVTALDGRLPVNSSGGSLARGHAPGATGVAQIHEVLTQFRGTAEGRQIPGAPSVALACVAGGTIRFETAVAAAHVLVRE